MNPIDETVRLIQLSVAPVFLLTGVATLLGVLSGRLARVVDRARVLEERLETSTAPSESATRSELQILGRRGRLIYRAIWLSTLAALMVCLCIASLFMSGMFQYSIGPIVRALFVAAMLASISSLMFFLREVVFAIRTFEIGLPAKKTATTG